MLVLQSGSTGCSAVPGLLASLSGGQPADYISQSLNNGRSNDHNLAIVPSFLYFHIGCLKYQQHLTIIQR